MLSGDTPVIWEITLTDTLLVSAPILYDSMLSELKKLLKEDLAWLG